MKWIDAFYSWTSGIPVQLCTVPLLFRWVSKSNPKWAFWRAWTFSYSIWEVMMFPVQPPGGPWSATEYRYFHGEGIWWNPTGKDPVEDKKTCFIQYQWGYNIYIYMYICLIYLYKYYIYTYAYTLYIYTNTVYIHMHTQVYIYIYLPTVYKSFPSTSRDSFTSFGSSKFTLPAFHGSRTGWATLLKCATKKTRGPLLSVESWLFNSNPHIP